MKRYNKLIYPILITSTALIGYKLFKKKSLTFDDIEEEFYNWFEENENKSITDVKVSKSDSLMTIKLYYGEIYKQVVFNKNFLSEKSKNKIRKTFNRLKYDGKTS